MAKTATKELNPDEMPINGDNTPSKTHNAMVMAKINNSSFLCGLLFPGITTVGTKI